MELSLLETTVVPQEEVFCLFVFFCSNFDGEKAKMDE